MKKYVIILSICLMSLIANVSFAETPDPSKVNLKLTVDYKNNAAKHNKEREFNSNIQLTANRWQVIGKMLSEKNNNLMIVMAKLLKQENNTYTIQFMLVDSDAKETVVFEPQAKIMLDSPAEVSIAEGERSLDINVLAS